MSFKRLADQEANVATATGAIGLNRNFVTAANDRRNAARVLVGEACCRPRGTATTCARSPSPKDIGPTVRRPPWQSPYSCTSARLPVILHRGVLLTRPEYL